MTQRARKPARTLSLKDAYETEFARRELERRAAAELQRQQEAQDLAGSEALYEALIADPEFLKAHDLSADRRRYIVTLNHAMFRITAYFDRGKVALTLSDRRGQPSATGLRREDTAEDAADALRLIALMLVDEIR